MSLFSWLYDSNQLNKAVLHKPLQQIAFKKSQSLQGLFPFECSHKEKMMQYVHSYENRLSLTSDLLLLFLLPFHKFVTVFSIKFIKAALVVPLHSIFISNL